MTDRTGAPAEDAGAQPADAAFEARREATAALAAGLVHEMGNILTIISANVEIAAARTSDPAATEALRHALDAVTIGACLGRRYSALAGPAGRASHRRVAAQPASSIEQIARVLRRMLGSAFRVETMIAPDIWPVRIESATLEAILVMLAMNAREAMPDGGRLLIAATNSPASAPGADRVTITVSDSGCGMPEDVRRRAAEPFFSTKPGQSGAGLGLAAVARWCTDAGGSLDISSTEGAGTTVTLQLPRFDANGSAPEPRST